MCEICGRIGAEGIPVGQLIDHEFTLSRISKLDDPIFTDKFGKEWELQRDPIYEDFWFVPVQDGS